jgi:hypothetical protein
MAKAGSRKTKPTSAKKKPKKLTSSSLIALPTAASAAVNVNVVFKSGLGQITSSLFRNGVLINMQSISSSGNIHLSDVQSGDVISINGICAGTASITIGVSTTPATPEHFTAGFIFGNYVIN